MTDASLNELGPSTISSSSSQPEQATSPARWPTELLALVDAGTIRVIDILILTKNEDGSVDAMELSDVGELGRAAATRGRARRAVGRGGRRAPRRRDGAGEHRRRAHLGEPVGGAVRLRGAAIRWPADRQRTDPDPGDHRLDRGRRSPTPPKENDMPLRPARVGRVGVIGAPVAKTAVVAAAVTPGPTHRLRRPQSSLPPSHQGDVAGASEPEPSPTVGGSNDQVDRRVRHRSGAVDMLYFFLFFIWIWLLIIVFGDIFRSHDLSGWGEGAVVDLRHLGAVPRRVRVPDRTRPQDAGPRDAGGAGTGRGGPRSTSRACRRARAPPTRSRGWPT